MQRHVKRVVCAMSGGVDSLVAAIMLKRAKLDVIGVFMRNWDVADEKGHCSSDADRNDAYSICQRLNIAFKEESFVKDYWNDVFMNFLEDYQRGLTPNPDILCNRYIKFGRFYNHIMSQYKADALATGHYAKSSFGPLLENYDDTVMARLLKPKDSWKDQTFFLSQISQTALRRTVFPLADLTKADVRQIALGAGFSDIVKKKESMGICFIGSRNFHKFMREYVENKPGDIVDIDTGDVVGTHNGIHLYTIGQSCSPAAGTYFTVSKNAVSNVILATEKHSHPALFSNALVTDVVHWIRGAAPSELLSSRCMRLQFQFQHVHKQQWCEVTLLPSGGLYIELDEYMRAVTPGQFAVLYSGEECLGSGKIVAAIPALHDDSVTGFGDYNEMEYMKSR